MLDGSIIQHSCCRWRNTSGAAKHVRHACVGRHVFHYCLGPIERLVSQTVSRYVGWDYLASGRLQRLAHDLCDRNLEKVRAWAGLDLPAGTAGDFLKFGAHGTGAHSAYPYAYTSEFSPKRFREACDVSLGSGVNGVTRDRKKTSRRTDIENSTPAVRDHLRKQMASERRERDHVYECHLLISHWIARGKGPAIAEPGVID